MKKETKELDCVEMMHRGALRIYEETKGMTIKQELAYWRQRHEALIGQPKRPPRPTLTAK